MNRASTSWSRVTVCVGKQTVAILGQTSEGTGKSLSISRVKLFDEMIEAEADETIVSSGAFKQIASGVALLGFLDLKFATYIGLITRVNLEGKIGPDNHVYSTQEVEWIPISHGVNAANKIDAHHLHLVNNLLKSGDFFFSDSLNLCGGSSRFWWNKSHASPLSRVSPEWTIHVMHGSFKSFAFNSLERRFQFVLIARRSAEFAGTRFRKRGINFSGDAANEVETEQILIAYGPPDRVMSFTQIRGSVPLHWSQDAHGLLGKPEIVIKNVDIALESTKLHFTDLLNRYGCPVSPVSLLLTKEGSGEAALGSEYAIAIEYLRSVGLTNVAGLTQFDLKGACVDSSDPELAGTIIPSVMYSGALALAVELVAQSGWTENEEVQKGIIRTNCVDCLDRTSIFQYIVGLHVLSEQLIDLGVLAMPLRPTWALVGEASTLLRRIEDMFDGVSDQLAFQYAGTAAHKKYSSQHRQSSLDSGIISSGRELFISLSRHYSSTFSDADKQHAMNLFLHKYRDVSQRVSGDVCNVDGIDKFVHSLTATDVKPAVTATQRPSLSSLTSTKHQEGYESIWPQIASTPVLFNPTASPSPSASPRSFRLSPIIP